MTDKLFNDLRSRIDHKSLKKSFETIYDILLSDNRYGPPKTGVSSTYQVVDREYENGDAITVPVVLAHDGALGLAGIYEGDADIVVRHGTDVLTRVGMTKNNGVVTMLFVAKGLVYETEHLTVEVVGGGKFGPFAFYFANEPQNLESVGPYQGATANNALMTTVYARETQGGKFIHIGAAKQFSGQDRPMIFPSPSQENELVGWGMAASGRDYQLGEIEITNNAWEEIEPGVWQSNTTGKSGDMIIPIIESFPGNAAFFMMVEGENEAASRANFNFAYRYISAVSGNLLTSRVGYDDHYVGRHLVKIEPYNTTAQDIIISTKGSKKVTIRAIRMFTLDKMLEFGIGHTTIPLHDGLKVSYVNFHPYDQSVVSAMSSIEIRHKDEN